MSQSISIIVNLAGLGEDARDNWDKGLHIPADHRPTFIHLDKDLAETELLRLAAAHPERKFALFDAVAFAQPSPATSLTSHKIIGMVHKISTIGDLVL